MKRTILFTLVGLALTAGAADAALIAFWNFNDTTDLGTDLRRINALGTPTAHSEYASDYVPTGSKGAEISVWSGDDTSEGNLSGTNGLASGAIESNFGGMGGDTLNWPPEAGGTAVPGDALTIVGGSVNNGHYFLIELDDAIQNCVLTYATRGGGTQSGGKQSFTTHTVDYSTDGTTWTPLGSHNAQQETTWTTHTITLGNVFTGTSGHEKNLIRVAVSGANGSSQGYGAYNRFDNVQVTGDVVPEPVTMVVLALGSCLFMFLGRRRT